MRFAAEAGANGTLPFAFKFKVPTPKAARYILQGMLITRTLGVMRALCAEVLCSVARELRFRLSNDQRKTSTEVNLCQYKYSSCSARAKMSLTKMQVRYFPWERQKES